MSDQRSLGSYGLQAKEYLEQNCPRAFKQMQESGQLHQHLQRLDQSAESLAERMHQQKASPDQIQEEVAKLLFPRPEGMGRDPLPEEEIEGQLRHLK